MVTKIFVDTNILVGYLLLSGIEKTRKSEEEKQVLWKKYSKIKPSYDFILKILSSENKDFYFIASGLVFSEIFHCLYEEAVCQKMRDDGVPLSSWIRLKNRFSSLIEDFEIEELDNVVYGLYHSKKIKVITEHYNLNLISKLILKYQFMTQDSILISTAIEGKYKFFVTRDEELLNRFKKTKIKKIKMISSEEAIKRFFPEK